MPFGVLLLPTALPDADENGSYTVDAQLAALAGWAGSAAAGLVPVADTTGHALICLDLRARARPAVVLVDMDRDPGDPRALTHLADTWTDLLRLLREP